MGVSVRYVVPLRLRGRGRMTAGAALGTFSFVPIPTLRTCSPLQPSRKTVMPRQPSSHASRYARATSSSLALFGRLIVFDTPLSV